MRVRIGNAKEQIFFETNTNRRPFYRIDPEPFCLLMVGRFGLSLRYRRREGACLGRLLSFSVDYGDKERISRPYARFFCNRDRKNQVALRREKGLSGLFPDDFPGK